MKKFVALFLAMIMALSLVACGDKGPAVDDKGIEAGSNKSASGSTDKDVYIDFWGVWSNDNYRAQFWQEKAAEFCAQYEAETGISVDIEYVGQGGSYAQLSEKLAAGSVTKELPVISQVEEQATARFYPLAANIKDYVSADVVDNYLPGLLVSCTHGGNLVAVPAGRSYIVTMVNKDLLEKAGHSVDELANWTWDDYYTIAKDIAALGDDVYGCAAYWDEDAWPWESALYSNGGSIDNEDGTKIAFTAEQGAKILDLNVKMMTEGIEYSGYNEKDPDSIDEAFYPLWGAGKLGMYTGSITMYKSGMKYREGMDGAADFGIVVAKQPAGDAGFSVVTGGSNMMIMAQATETQKKVAAAYFEFLAQDENCAAWNQVSGYEAFTKSVKDAPAFKETTDADPNLLNIYQFVEDAHARPTTPQWQEMYLNVLMPDLVALSQNPAAYTPDKTQAMVENWIAGCQKILDESK